MVRISFSPLVIETSQRLYGISALIELVYSATPDVELQERDALKQLAEHESWEYSDYNTEAQFLDAKFKYWLPKLAAYSIIILLNSTAETQLLAYARMVGKSRGCAFEPSDLNGSVLDKTVLYVKKTSGAELTKNSHWKVLKDLQTLRNIIVHRAGKPGDKEHQVKEMCNLYQGVSLDTNPYTMWHDSELGVTIHSCRYFAGEVEQFFKELFRDANLPVHGGLWPNIQSGYS